MGEVRVRREEVSPQTRLGQLFQLNHLLLRRTGMVEEHHSSILHQGEGEQHHLYILYIIACSSNLNVGIRIYIYIYI